MTSAELIAGLEPCRICGCLLPEFVDSHNCSHALAAYHQGRAAAEAERQSAIDAAVAKALADHPVLRFVRHPKFVLLQNRYVTPGLATQRWSAQWDKGTGGPEHSTGPSDEGACAAALRALGAADGPATVDGGERE